MLTFGLISSVFDYLTFAVLLIGFKTQQELFQSSWFILSILTELLILLVMRTQKPFFKSKPAPILLYSTIGVGVFTMILSYLPLHGLLNIELIHNDIFCIAGHYRSIHHYYGNREILFL